ncbi:fluoride efflux transporter FluC [Isoalcanivorax indicus]|uniref:fluoride efflux transporter FluC n=1 Tax=Isoalcanivorax indicus TaxID=2202653 RepID=UPI000DBAD62E|nr:CrcB family protein [Isoalcanivorax indicus]
MTELPWPGLLGLVALGGGAGALVRLALVEGAARRLGATWPWGTWLANIGGALLAGMLWAVLHADGAGNAHEGGGGWLWWLLIAGLLGSLTTVSSFSLQTLLLAHKRGLGAAAVNLLVSVCGCLFAVILGGWLMRTLLLGWPA